MYTLFHLNFNFTFVLSNHALQPIGEYSIKIETSLIMISGEAYLVHSLTSLQRNFEKQTMTFSNGHQC